LTLLENVTRLCCEIKKKLFNSKSSLAHPAADGQVLTAQNSVLLFSVKTAKDTSEVSYEVGKFHLAVRFDVVVV